jgi:hypothetical protein
MPHDLINGKHCGSTLHYSPFQAHDVGDDIVTLDLRHGAARGLQRGSVIEASSRSVERKDV